MATQKERDWLDVYGQENRERGLYIVARTMTRIQASSM
jgi:hypothetical protein